MRALLDVNVLIAVHDESHTHHASARAWLSANLDNGWASCAITQNGFVRVLSQPRYPLEISAAGALALLQVSCSAPHHEFWPSDVALVDPTAVSPHSLLGPQQVTDIYLLALTVRHGGRLVTFDRTVPTAAVPGASDDSLVVLG
ncbi:TA system VapC family ribonuclease toxin [Pseudactinotalea sp.]|uniref:TA system VapC family ribonuclease toxin n=1 Tax=Pseudactinotalea sp. TaxID=1926260 RepID=UPI003B3B512A